jgi:hypothetical protein
MRATRLPKHFAAQHLARIVIIASVIIGSVAIGLLASVRPAGAQTAEIISTYTSTAPKDCRVIPRSKSEPDDGFFQVCAGMGNLIVTNAEGDLREVVSVGRTRAAAGNEPAAQAWFGPFSSTTTTIEWRHPKGGAPFAIIQRWHLADNDDTGPDNRPRTKQMLVVTRLPPGPVCHVAYIDVKANPNANEIARQAAEKARAFNCGKDKVRVEGASGRAIELAMPR